jgi:hypothetical protein
MGGKFGSLAVVSCKRPRHDEELKDMTTRRFALWAYTPIHASDRFAMAANTNDDAWVESVETQLMGLSCAAASATATLQSDRELAVACILPRTGVSVESQGRCAAQSINKAAAAGKLLSLMLKPLSGENKAIVDDALSQYSGDADDKLFTKYSIDVFRMDLRVLRPTLWLSDNSITFFMELIKDRHVERMHTREEERCEYSSFLFHSVQ